MSHKKAKPSETKKVGAMAAKRYSRYTSASEFNPDYGYVIKDLRRIGILAGSFFVVLVVLSFFLR